MKILVVFLLLHTACCFCSFGLATFIVQRSKYSRLSPMVAAAIWPTFFVAILSLCGYLKASQFSQGFFIIVATALLIWSAIAAFNYWRAPTFGASDWSAIIAVHSLAVIAGLVAIVPQIWHNDFGYFFFSNGEFLNYAQFASFTLGLQHSTLPVPWEIHSQAGRDGIDFLNAAVSLITQQQPAHIVQFVSALLRASYCAAVFTIIYALLNGSRWQMLTVALIGSGFIVYNLDIFQFQASFMAANVALTGLVSSMGILVVFSRLNWHRALVGYVICTFGILVSYPEAMPLVKIVEIAFVAERLIRTHDAAPLRFWISANCLVALINPFLVFSKIQFVWSQAFGPGGWNIIAEPETAAASYMARLAGIEPMYISKLSLLPIGYAQVVYITLIAVALSAIYAIGRTTQTIAVWLVPIGVILLHLLAYYRIAPNYYGAAKFIWLWLWLIPIGVSQIARQTPKIVSLTMMVATSLFATANAFAFITSSRYKNDLPYFYSSKDAANALSSAQKWASTNTPIIILESNDQIFVWYWTNILDASGIPLHLRAGQVISFQRSDAPQSQDDVALSEAITIRPTFTAQLRVNPTDIVELRNDQLLQTTEGNALIYAGRNFVEFGHPK